MSSARVLTELDDGLGLGGPVAIRGIPMGRRMTVVRLGDGGLLLHSPAPLVAELDGALSSIGDVRVITAASNLHGHLHMEAYRKHYPRAELLGTARLAEKRTDLDFDRLLGAGAVDADGEVQAAPLEGHRMLDEFELFHPATRTLTAGDLCFNIGRGWPIRVRLFANGPTMRRRLGPTPAFLSSIADRAAARRSIERMLKWDIDRVVPGHGDVIETGGGELLRTELLPRFDA